MENTYQNLWDGTKAMIWENSTAINNNIEKKKKKISTFHLTKMKNREQTKPKASTKEKSHKDYSENR